MATASQAAHNYNGDTANTFEEVLRNTQDSSILQMKMEHESIMAECRVRPRNFAATLQELEERIKAVPELAVAGIYSKPIGSVYEVVCACGHKYECGISWGGGQKSIRKEDCERCGKWDPKSTREVKKKARNLSIRMAEEIAEVYGFNRVHVALAIMDQYHVKVTASFFDYQKLRSWITESVVSKTYSTRNRAGVQVIPDDRFWGNVVKAEASKTVREAILRSVPAGLKLRAFAVCEKVAGEALKDDEVSKIVAAFADKGVGLDRLEFHIGRTRKEGWTKADRLELLEAWNAIKDNEATIEEIFGEETHQLKESPKQPKTSGGATIEDLARQTDDQPKPAAPEAAADQEPNQAAMEAASLEDEYGESLRNCLGLDELEGQWAAIVGDGRVSSESRGRLAKIHNARKGELGGKRTQRRLDG